jgi:hypothetical protein
MSASITAINCGTSVPRLGGTINLSEFPNLLDFICNSNDITAISGYETNANLRNIQFQQNKVTGPIPSLTALTGLETFRCFTNELTGSIPSFISNVKLVDFNCAQNALTGTIPSLSVNTKLEVFSCRNNQLTGSIPSLSGNPQLRVFSCRSNTLTGPIPSLNANIRLEEFECFSNALTGSIPSLANNALLTLVNCSLNQLTGAIPSLSALTQLRLFSCRNNQITSFEGGSVSNVLENFQAQNNLLTSSAVNAILAAFVEANKTTGTRILNLGGTGNAAPTGQGITDKATLQSRGWTVTTN